VELDRYVADRRAALFRFAVVLTGDPALADDVVSDVIAKAFERWDQVRAADNIHAYVRRMVVNEYLGWRRRSARTWVRGDMAELVPPADDHADTHADHHQLADELRRLPPKQRAAVVLRFYEGLPYSEIASILGSGENAIRSNVSRALQKLRVRLTDEPEEADHPCRQTIVGAKP
jgi:RNA polymerase sigma-70 factor (sigma-E family)